MPPSILIRDMHDFFDRRLAVRYLLQTMTNQLFQSVLFVLLKVAPERPVAYAKQTRRLTLRLPTSLPTLIRFFKSQLP